VLFAAYTYLFGKSSGRFIEPSGCEQGFLVVLFGEEEGPYSLCVCVIFAE
jgi:hypothetical protein